MTNFILDALNDSATIAQDKIIEFIKKFESTKIDQILYYFSGHGHRDSNNFYFCFKNTDLDTLKSTTITNEDIDGYLRRLNPSVAVKIVDACYSGENYIKDTDLSLIRKHVDKQYTFDEVYFMYSSRGTEESEADLQYSKFTKLFFDSINSQQQSEKITYKSIIDYITDFSRKKLNHTPIFVTQGTYLSYLFNNLEIPKKVLSALTEKEDFGKTSQTTQDPNVSLLALIKANAAYYCDEEVGREKLNKFIESIEKLKISDLFNSLFDIKITSHSHILYNEKDIGVWLSLNKQKDDFLAVEQYEKQQFTEKKYIQYPRKPRTGFGSRNFSNRFAASVLGFSDEEDEYKLEDVTITKNVITGVDYLVSLEKVFVSYTFHPKKEFQNLKNYAVNFALIFSKKDIVLFYSMEKLKVYNWHSPSSPTCPEWNFLTLSLKNFQDKDLDGLVKRIDNFIMDDIKSTLPLNKKAESSLEKVVATLPVARK